MIYASAAYYRTYNMSINSNNENLSEMAELRILEFFLYLLGLVFMYFIFLFKFGLCFSDVMLKIINVICMKYSNKIICGQRFFSFFINKVLILCWIPGQQSIGDILTPAKFHFDTLIGNQEWGINTTAVKKGLRLKFRSSYDSTIRLWKDSGNLILNVLSVSKIQNLKKDKYFFL